MRVKKRKIAKYGIFLIVLVLLIVIEVFLVADLMKTPAVKDTNNPANITTIEPEDANASITDSEIDDNAGPVITNYTMTEIDSGTSDNHDESDEDEETDTTDSGDEYDEEELNDYLLLSMKFDEGAGSTAADGARYHNTAQVYGASWSNDCKSGKCLKFDGVNDYVELTDSSDLKINGPMTVEFWFKMSGVNAYRAGKQGIVSLSDNINKGYSIDFNKGSLMFQKGDGTTGNGNLVDYDVVYGPGMVYSPDRWYHIAAVWDGTTEHRSMRIYVDGILAEQLESYYRIGGATTPFQSRIVYPNLPFYVGRNKGNFFNGTIDELRVYDKALTNEEVEARAGALIDVQIEASIINSDERLDAKINPLKNLNGRKLVVNARKINRVFEKLDDGVITTKTEQGDVAKTKEFDPIPADEFTYDSQLDSGDYNLEFRIINKSNGRTEYEYVTSLRVDKVQEFKHLALFDWRRKYDQVNSNLTTAVSDSPIDTYAIPLVGSVMHALPTFDYTQNIAAAKQSNKHIMPRLYMNFVVQCKIPPPNDTDKNNCDKIKVFDAWNEAGVLEDFYTLFKQALKISNVTKAGGVFIDLEPYSYGEEAFYVSEIAKANGKTEAEVLQRGEAIGREMADMINAKYPEADIWFTYFRRPLSDKDKFEWSIVEGMLKQAKEKGYKFNVIEGGELSVLYTRLSVEETKGWLNSQYGQFMPYLNEYPNLKLGATLVLWQDIDNLPADSRAYSRIDDYEKRGGVVTTRTVDDFQPILEYMFKTRQYVWVYVDQGFTDILQGDYSPGAQNCDPYRRVLRNARNSID